MEKNMRSMIDDALNQLDEQYLKKAFHYVFKLQELQQQEYRIKVMSSGDCCSFCGKSKDEVAQMIKEPMQRLRSGTLITPEGYR